MNRHTNDASLAAMAASAVTYRQLIWQLAKRDIIGRYRGSLLGLAQKIKIPFGAVHCSSTGFQFG